MLVVAFSLIGSAAFAQDPANSKLVVVGTGESGIYKVIYKNPSASKVKMAIETEAGKTVFSQSLRVSEGFVRNVNFNGMAPGAYSIVVADENGKHAGQLTFGVNASTLKTVHVSKIASNDSKYLLSVANDGGDEINVRIFDGENNVVHNQTLAVNGTLGLVYDLKSVSGAPTFEVSDNAGTVRTIRY